MKPFFSIILPAYNAEETLEEAVESALEQSFSDWELIVVNDGSVDGSAKILSRLKKENPNLRFHILNQQNKGLGAARNAAIAVAEGKYCAFLDADDIWRPEKLESCYEFLKNSPECEVLYHPVIVFGRTEDKERKAYPVQSVEDVLENGLPLVPSASLVKTEVLKEFPFSTEPNFHGAEDLHLWLRLLKEGKTFHLWPEPLTWYREEGGMSTNIEQHLRNTLNVLKHFYDKGFYNQTYLELARRRKYYEVARFYQKRGARFEAERYYSAADSKSVKIAGLRFLNRLGIKW